MNSFFSITGWGIDLDYCDIEWFALGSASSLGSHFLGACVEVNSSESSLPMLGTPQAFSEK